MFVVMIKCEDYCEAWEAGHREMFRTEDPVAAIHRSSNLIDQTHQSWVEEE